jgi:hypothetical protein
MVTHLKSPLKKKVKKINGAELKIFPINFNCNCSSIESKNKGIDVIKYQEWLNVISTLVFDVLMQKIKI